MKKILLILLLQIYLCSCQRENINFQSLDGYVVGYDPCTIYQQYRIGYIIISEDLKDTLLSYNISDQIFKMPSSILLIQSDTIYKIPERYFEHFLSTPYFPDSLRYKYGIKITYLPSVKDELIYNGCYTITIFLNLEQIMIKSIRKKSL